MINFRIAREFSNLSESELRRLQLRLGIILRRTDDPHSMEKVVVQALYRLGKPHDIIYKSGEDCQNAFVKIISHFGSIRIKNLTDKEMEILANHPYIVRLEKEKLIIYAEAMEIIMSDQAMRKERFLLSHIYNLPLNEKKAWARWLKKGDQIEKSQRNLTGEIYMEIAKQRMANPETPSQITAENQPDYLDEIFPQDPAVCSSGWFFRGVLPFYRSMQLTEEDTNSKSELHSYVKLFKLGLLVAFSEPPVFGEPLRWRIYATRESLPMEKRITEKKNERENPEELPFPR